MRLLFPSLLLLCAVGAIAWQAQTKPASPSHRVKYQEPANHDKDDAGSHAPPLEGSTRNTNTTFVLQESAQQNDEGRKQPSYWDKVISPEILPIWIASLIAIIGTVVAVCTLMAIRDESTKIKEVAIAATRNAEALMLGDRAWLLMKKTLTQDVIQDPALLSLEEMMLKQQLSHCIFTIKNYGKTPARMIAWKYELQIGNSAHSVPDPSIYDMSTLPTYTPDMVPQRASVAQQADFRTAPNPQDFLDIAKGTKFLWLCGTIWYEDTFERGVDSKHETVFCYLWETRMTSPKPAWIPAGPREYHRAT